MAKQNEVDVGITVKKDVDFSEWFTQLIQKAELADVRYNIKGFVPYMPWSVISMKRMYAKMESILERKGHLPLIMPALIPESNFKIEAAHVEGFAPQVFWVTEHGDGEKFEQRYALRPTSETALYQMYSLWIRSYKDLPFKRYQSCQVWRHETKQTRPFFRTREFHWIEAHDVFATEEQAYSQVKEDMESTYEFLHDYLAIPFIFFQRPSWDTFPGAVHTYAADALMPSGKVMQLPSTHMLGQNFSKPFNVKYADENGSEKYGYITCYGPAISRIYGAMIALHGDDKGLILPFDVAPTQIVIVPILFDDSKDKVLKKCEEIKKRLSKYHVHVDDRPEYTPGYKFNHWELRGVPIRIEVGPKDLEKKSVVMTKRGFKDKRFVPEADLVAEVDKVAANFTKDLIAKFEKQFMENIVDAKSFEEMKKAVDSDKIVRMSFCSNDKDGTACAEKVEKEAGAFVRGIRLDEKKKPEGNCAICGNKANAIVYAAKSY